MVSTVDAARDPKDTAPFGTRGTEPRRTAVGAAPAGAASGIAITTAHNASTLVKVANKRRE